MNTMKYKKCESYNVLLANYLQLTIKLSNFVFVLFIIVLYILINCDQEEYKKINLKYHDWF